MQIICKKCSKDVTMEVSFQTKLNSKINFKDFNRDHSGELRHNDGVRDVCMMDMISIQTKINVIKNWCDWYEGAYPSNKVPNREVCLWFIGGNNSTPFQN